MPKRLQLESFETAEDAQDRLIEMVPAKFDQARLASFEKGYQTGWDDAVAAQSAETARLRSDLGRNMQALSLTYQEACQNVLDALQPLLVDICAKVLPTMARQSLGAIVAEQLVPIAEGLSSAPITIVANPAALPQIEEILAREHSLPLIFTEDPGLGEGQVYLRFAETETRIDLDAVIAAITEALSIHFNVQTKENSDD